MVQIVVAGGDDVAAPPAFDPFIRINFPSRVIEHGVDSHQHEHKERDTYMEREDEGEDGQEPSRTGGFNRIE